MRPQQIPVAMEGVPFIGLAVLASMIFAILQWAIPAVAAFAVSAFVLYFFRDPDRIVPHEPDLVVSPADGRVIEVVEVESAPLLKGRARRISIFMNVFNVHVNRSPMSGTVQDIKYSPGTFIPADRERAMIQNEQNAVLLEDDQGRRITVVQVAGLIARRIVCRTETGDWLRRGERFGMIRFGSRLDCYLPLACDVLVKAGQRTTAGETVLARWSKNG